MMNEYARPEVIVIEDEKDVADMIRVVLSAEGFDVAHYFPDPKVVEQIMEDAPRVVILDITMPVIDGVEVFLQMRENPTTASTPVIFFTAAQDNFLARVPNYAEMGAALVRKPATDELVERVRTMFG